MKLYGSEAEDFEPSEVRVSVFGLGKMGLPLAAVFADAGFDVIGVDIDEEVVETVNRGESHVKNEPGLDEMVASAVERGDLRATADGPAAAAESDVMVILTPTLITEDRSADLSTVEAASRDISQGLEEGDLVILESTVPPGTTRDVLKPLLDGDGAEGYGVAYCPERTSSGRAIQDITGAYPKIVGGLDEESGAAAEKIYGAINSSGVIRVSDTTTAEAVKVFEGVYRDVNIALANQLARISSEYGFDVLEAIDAANTQPFCDIHDPGCGVGGHCIPVYPHFLIDQVGEGAARLLSTAREVNDAVPERFVRLLETGLEDTGRSLDESRVLLLGLAFRDGVEETRFSPGVEVANRLQAPAGELVVNDPVVEDVEATYGFESRELSDLALDGFDAIVVCTDHEEYASLNFPATSKDTVMVDGRNLYESETITDLGYVYKNAGSRTSE